MPAQILAQTNPIFLQVASVMVALTLLLWHSARVSRRFIATFPDDLAEKPELLAAARLQWFMVAPLLALVIMYVVLVFLLAPIAALAALFVVALAPFLIVLFVNQPALDAPYAALETLRARLRHQQPDPQRWLAQYCKLKERRRRLGWMRYVMLVLVLILAAMGVAGYVTIDRVLGVRLQALAMVEDVKQALGPQVTVFTQTPPCVAQCTLYLIPPPGMKAPEAQKLAATAQQALRQRRERRAWRIAVKTGEVQPLAEGEYRPGNR